MKIKYISAIMLAAVMFSSCASGQETTKTKTTKRVVVVHEVKETKKEPTSDMYIWPVFFGNGIFFFSETGPTMHLPGYGFSGGVTFSMFEKDVRFLNYIGNLFFFTDALYSYRNYDGYPQNVSYNMEESTFDIALAGGYRNTYIGGYIQFPNKATVRVKDWTMDDFDGIDRSTSFSFMFGYRITGSHMGIDFRLLLGQGPGGFMDDKFGDHWLGQASVGIMGGF